jgi:hypothetical protein
VITLGPDAMFSLIFNHAFGAEAMAIARMFDWKSIQAQINSWAHVEGRTADGSYVRSSPFRDFIHSPSMIERFGWFARRVKIFLDRGVPGSAMQATMFRRSASHRLSKTCSLIASVLHVTLCNIARVAAMDEWMRDPGERAVAAE